MLKGVDIIEQLGFFKESIEEKITKQMQIAIKKGIVPGASVILDNDKSIIYTVRNLNIGNDNDLTAYLHSKTHIISWKVTSESLTSLRFNK